MTEPKHTNRLVDETSPYLLQHAHNPVDWYPWGEAARTRAREEDRLILLSIGYSACHWCHVMERESFENESTAELMNTRFVNIKVDREERPDLDDIYMAATVALNAGHGGWPMTVFLTPDLQPVFAGTYFPPDDASGRPGFPQVLRQIADAWDTDRAAMAESAARITETLRSQRQLGPALNVGVAELRGAAEQFGEDFDAEYGGFGSAPKFPPAVSLMLLLRLYHRFEDPAHLEMVTRTLDGMAEGGLYDHVGGGFARYSTDRRWLVPHFEKMLYDNALLARAYLEAWQVTGFDRYRRVATETLDYVLRDMTDPSGGCYSATDADSEGEEGKFFVWRPEEIESVLGPDDAVLFNAYYDITPAGNWEGTNIPRTPRPLAEVAAECGMDLDESATRLAAARSRVFAAREQRVKPGLDDKILTAWNGLMISAFAEGYRMFGEVRYADAAHRAADFLCETHTDGDGRLLRTSRLGRAHLDAYLEDYAGLCEGLIDLYEATGARRHLDRAAAFADRMLSEFSDPESGAFYHTAAGHEALLMRYRDGTDGATPSPNAVAASALLRLSRHLDGDVYRNAATRAVMAYGPFIQRFPRGFSKSLLVVDALLDEPLELALVTADDDTETAFRSALGRRFLPNRVQAVLPPDQDGSGLPLTEGKIAVGGATTLYVCRRYTCQAPITDPTAVDEALDSYPRHSLSPTIAVRRPGRASPAGTARYAQRSDGVGFTPLADTGLTVSKLGFGGYRTDEVTTAHRDALERAIGCGVNVVDTSTNYMDGGSERLVGAAVGALVDAGELNRDEVIVVSKIGYIQGSNFDLASAREARGEPFADVTKISDGLWHCIHPDFLDDQLNRSLDRLELDTLDVCLLHNPEYFLTYTDLPGGPNVVRDAFYRRMTDAFRYFEAQVEAGRLQWYGVSSNTVAGHEADREATSLERMLEAASEAGGSAHHFRVLQLPLNLFESHATRSWDRSSTALLARAANAGVAVLANRPLNAFVDGDMIRLADFVASDGTLDSKVALRELTELENKYRETIGVRVTAPKSALSPAEYFQWATQLELLLDQTLGMEQWAQIDHQIRGRVGSLAAVLDRNLRGDLHERWSEWKERYAVAINTVLAELRRRAVNHAADRSAEIRRSIEAVLPPERVAQSLSRTALWTVASTPGVTVVLTGMRSPEYVMDATGMLGWPPVAEPDAVYEAVRTTSIAGHE